MGLAKQRVVDVTTAIPNLAGTGADGEEPDTDGDDEEAVEGGISEDPDFLDALQEEHELETEAPAGGKSEALPEVVVASEAYEFEESWDERVLTELSDRMKGQEWTVFNTFAARRSSSSTSSVSSCHRSWRSPRAFRTPTTRPWPTVRSSCSS